HGEWSAGAAQHGGLVWVWSWQRMSRLAGVHCPQRRFDSAGWARQLQQRLFASVVSRVDFHRPRDADRQCSPRTTVGDVAAEKARPVGSARPTTFTADGEERSIGIVDREL